jgi:hypothetical protein
MFTGLEMPRQYVCYRGTGVSLTGSQQSKEFEAEEAGRAAAISYRHLRESESFRELMALADRLGNARAWRCLYQAAEDLCVNVSALVTQLKLEGWIAVDREGGRNILRVQRPLEGMFE